MIVFPNCKINLGLNILGKREDGFHDLETVFFPVQLKDALEIIQHPESENQFTNSGILAEEKEENNICIKAYQLLKKDFPQLPSIKMHLHKTIPIGAGLGGGSADAAFTLKLLNEKFNLTIPGKRLSEYASQLGSDCPFFIINKPCIATGRGEILQEIDIALSNYQLILINPGIHINTAWAFSQLSPLFTNTFIHTVIHQPVETWKEALFNDFEKPVFSKYPEIKNIKEKLYKHEAIYASMSGSGSTIYGLFEKTKMIKIDFPENYFITVLSL
jgi:4-diphosphocytidyl-2-C-methyl-D-erythritol kinase